MKAITINSKVVDGNLKQNRNLIKDAIASFEGKEVSITIKRKKKTRSNNQNAYYWGVLLPLMQDAVKNEWGEVWSIDMAHEFFKMHFLYYEKLNEETGEVIKLPKSTTDNSTIEMEEYHSNIREFLKVWFNVTAPLPNEDIRIELLFK